MLMMNRNISLTINNKPVTLTGRRAAVPARGTAGAWLHQRQRRLRGRGMRRLHRAGGWCAAGFMPVPGGLGRRPQRSHRRGRNQTRSALRGAASLSGHGRRAVRLLHAGPDHDLDGLRGKVQGQRKGLPYRDQARPCRQPMPLHRLRGHHPGG